MKAITMENRDCEQKLVEECILLLTGARACANNEQKELIDALEQRLVKLKERLNRREE